MEIFFSAYRQIVKINLRFPRTRSCCIINLSVILAECYFGSFYTFQITSFNVFKYTSLQFNTFNVLNNVGDQNMHDLAGLTYNICLSECCCWEKGNVIFIKVDNQ